MPKEQSRAHRPHFRRQPHVNGRENSHSPNCLYNVGQRIRVIRAGSAEALVRERSKSGPPRYRLVVPEAFGPAASQESVDGGVQVVAERLTTVLNTAAKIAALLEDYTARDVDPNIEWYAECRGKRVEWLSFLYIPQRTWALRDRLKAGRPELTHPVAVIFAAYELKTPWLDRARRRRRPRDGYRAATYPLLPEPDGPMAEELVVVGEQELVETAFAAGPGKYYIGYGMWTRGRYGHGPRNFPGLSLRMNNVGQVSPLPAGISPTALSRWRYRPPSRSM
ncbi:hypothetical protein ACIBEK_31330 [Nocardia fusca]|uniref:hypothetical protein n=1 Tax=Nocardia fusca TaxID=941183 RepID=UPI00379C56F4